MESLRLIPPQLKRRLAPDDSFGLGLRLSNAEAVELLSGSNLDQFKTFLSDNGLFVALINGFPFAGFHDCSLKDQVFAPDWHTTERVDYTIRLMQILAELLPDEMDGGVSTCPLSYKRWRRNSDWPKLIQNVVRVAQTAFEIRRETDHFIHLDIEPEPDGLVENTAEFIAFFDKLVSVGAPLLAHSAEISRPEAESALRDHVALCYDVCHFAVEHEAPAFTLNAIRSAGIRVGRAQISSAVRVAIPESESARERLRCNLLPLSDATYLHQVIGEQERFADLPDGLAQLSEAASSEWRIHYHVPLFTERYGEIGSTQPEVRAALAELTPAVSRHLEIETYTWSVLPPDLKLDIVDSIEREYRWVLSRL
jgi:sugar phosphate isomerase/epimerase